MDYKKDTPPQIRIQFAAVVQLLCTCSELVDEDTRESIELAVADWCQLTGWTYRRSINGIELDPPQSDQLATTKG